MTFRPLHTFGPRQSARAVIPAIITQCMAGEIVRLGNLAPTRDLNYVANTVDGFVRSAAQPGILGKTINLGSGREISMGDLANLIAKLMGSPIRIEQDEERLRPDGSEVDRLLADNNLARSLLDWKPATDLETGLQITIDWMKQHMERYRKNDYII